MPDQVPFAHPWDEDVIVSKADVTVGGTPSTAVARYWGGDVPWMSSGDVHLRRISDVPGRITKMGLQASAAKMIEPPAVAIALAGQGKTRGTAALTEIALCTNQSVALIKSRNEELDALYLYYALDYRYEELRARSAGGGRAGLTKQIVQSVPIPLPQPKEQSRIAEILDTLDAAIRETEAVVAKLRQVKAGLLHDLLTRGLDEHGHLRDPARHPEQFQDSALGSIPTKWSCSELGEVLRERPKNGYSPVEATEFQGGFMLGLGCLTPNGFAPCQLKNAPMRDSNLAHYALAPGDLLISRSNTRELVALVGTFDAQSGPCFYPDLMMRLRPVAKLSARFLEAALRSPPVRRQLTNRACGTSGSMLKINAKDVEQTIVAFPETDEQDAILTKADEFEARLSSQESILSKLHSLKRGLAHDLLTGRVRVKVQPA